MAEDKPKDPEKDKLKIKSAKKMREIMTTYYIDAKTARENGKKVAWITSGGPVEALHVMDVIPVYPENHSAMIGATKMGGQLCELAENMGYCADICSYARSDIACATINGGPIGGLPAPDFLVCCNNICGTVMKWYEVQARYFGVPLFIFDTPICHTDFPEETRRYVEKQTMEYITFLEQACGKPFDLDRMMEVGRLSLQGQRLWQDILDTTMSKPSPMSAFDAFFFMAMIVTLRGTRIAVDFYQELLAEMRERAAQKIGVVPHEKYRLLWDNLAIWHKMKWLSEKLASHDACLVADTYTSAWCSSMKYLDENDFLKSMVAGYTRIYLNIGVDQMADIIKNMVAKYDVDGIVMHSNRSCKPYSLGQYDIRKRIQDEFGLPILMIEADMVDERSFSESQIETRIDAYMEMIKEKKG
ncbi:MAG TPA: 2-hydroxyacyl-CoA dehydratase family protein [Deltaproteobacteria bacterium]|nr:2-hydroxyacyl-CoA dehydratase family protein [Deltaproteobacteria bacterium]